MSVHLAIIEDNVEMLSSMQTYFDMCEDVELVCVNMSVEEFLEKCNSTKVDVLLLDLMLPGMSGIEGIPFIKTKFPAINIIVNTVLEDSGSIFNALKFGAVGYITKDASMETIKASVINAFNGMSIMSQEVAAKVLAYFKEGSSLIEKLSKKELDIAQSLKLGMSYKMIAFENKVSIDAIRFHVRNIYRKLAINSKGELINLMMQRNNDKPSH